MYTQIANNREKKWCVYTRLGYTRLSSFLSILKKENKIFNRALYKTQNKYFKKNVDTWLHVKY